MNRWEYCQLRIGTPSVTFFTPNGVVRIETREDAEPPNLDDLIQRREDVRRLDTAYVVQNLSSYTGSDAHAKMLAQLGRDGWELVSVSERDWNFKRLLQD